jgi:hypothetical protein
MDIYQLGRAIPENIFLSENNSKDPIVENPAQPTERTSIEILHE